MNILQHVYPGGSGILFLFDARFLDSLAVCHCQWQNNIELFSVGINSLVTGLSFLVNHVFKLPVVRTARIIFRGQSRHPAADATTWNTSVK